MMSEISTIYIREISVNGVRLSVEVHDAIEDDIEDLVVEYMNTIMDSILDVIEAEQNDR